MSDSKAESSTQHKQSFLKRFDEDQAIPEIDVRGKKKDYPSINDYYKAASRDDKPIQYQHGLSNYSSVQLGDDRISFKKSLSQDAYNLEVEDAQVQESSSLPPISFNQRKQNYEEANALVGLHKIHEMEQMMRDKLQQRTKTGPFQLRKTFKYFDRDGSGGIDFDEFQRAMELMGFQFTEIQQLALFARYDESCTGEVDYNDFVEKVMESDFKVVHASVKTNLDRMMTTLFSPHDLPSNQEGLAFGRDEEYDSDADSEEQEDFRRREVKKIFDVVDSDFSGFIDRNEVRTLVRNLGRDIPKEKIKEVFRSLDKDNSGHIEFDEFYDWFIVHCHTLDDRSNDEGKRDSITSVGEENE